MSMQVDMYGAILQSEQSRKEDRDQLLKELERVKADSSAISMLCTGILPCCHSANRPESSHSGTIN